MAHEAFDGLLPEGWSGGAPVTKYWNGNFAHLYRVTRPCASCGAEIAIDVTKQALLGTRQNAGLLLRNCPKCRAERKNGGTGSRGGTSRPIATGEVAAPPADDEETQKLRMMVSTMKSELDPLYEAHRVLYQENSKLRTQLSELQAKLALYELQPAMVARAKTMQDPVGDQLRKKFTEKMPWQ